MRSRPNFPYLWLVLWGVFALPAWAETDSATQSEVVIVSGHRGGNYDFLARRLRALLMIENERFVEVVQSDGSLENLARLDASDDRANVGFAQADALAHYLEDHPAFAEDLLVLSDVGRECAFVVVSGKSEVAGAADLKQERGHTIAVDSPNSGGAVTYEYLSRRDPGFRNTSPVNVDVMEALVQLRTGGLHPNLRSVLWVQSPLQISPPLKVVLESPDAFRLVPIAASDVKNAALPDGTPVYSFGPVSLHHGGNARKVETLCTRGLVVLAKSKLREDRRNELIAILLNSSTSLAPAGDR